MSFVVLFEAGSQRQQQSWGGGGGRAKGAYATSSKFYTLHHINLMLCILAFRLSADLCLIYLDF